MSAVALVSSLAGDVHPGQRERKYLLDGKAARAFWNEASEHLAPRLEDAARPVAYARTTYYDTRAGAFARSGQGRVARRLRVREYAAAATADGVPVLTGDCFVELKESAGGRRAKSRVRAHLDEVAALLARHTPEQVFPCVTTWYRRAVLTDAREALRVTLDDRLAFCAPVTVGAACVGREPPGVLARSPGFVLEVKLWEEPAWLTRALRGLHEAVGFSKFHEGMRAADGGTAGRWAA